MVYYMATPLPPLPPLPPNPPESPPPSYPPGRRKEDDDFDYENDPKTAVKGTVGLYTHAQLCECVAEAKKRRRKKRKPFVGLDKLSLAFRRALIRNFVLQVPAAGGRIELVPENPFRTALHVYVPVGFDACELFLHRTMDSGMEGNAFCEILTGGTYSPDCSCMLRFIQGEWCIRRTVAGAVVSLAVVHETISVPQRGQGE